VSQKGYEPLNEEHVHEKNPLDAQYIEDRSLKGSMTTVGADSPKG
jgi:hypothetical protein